LSPTPPPDSPDPEPGLSIGIRDEPAEALRVTVYGADQRALSVAITPLHALALAGRLIAAAARRLA
jgi:hypothetical protein